MSSHKRIYTFGNVSLQVPVEPQDPDPDSDPDSREDSSSPPPYGVDRTLSPPTAVFIISRGISGFRLKSSIIKKERKKYIK